MIAGEGICPRCVRAAKHCSLRPNWPVAACAAFEPDFTEDLARVRREGERFREAMNGESELAVFARSLREGRGNL